MQPLGPGGEDTDFVLNKSRMVPGTIGDLLAAQASPSTGYRGSLYQA